MVVRRRSGSSISDHPAAMVRFEPDEWPIGGVKEWRRAFLGYWHRRRHPGGLAGLMATLRVARRSAATGITGSDDEIRREVSRLEGNLPK